MVKILCVDDDSSLLFLYQEELSEEGYEVIVAGNGKEALEKYDRESPHLVILDIRMPITDGLETLNALLGRNRQLPVILNTAYSTYRDNFMTWGAEAYVIKSSDLSKLKKKIRKVLEKHGNLTRSWAKPGS